VEIFFSKKVYKRHTCYFVIAALSSNFIRYFYNAFDTLGQSMEREKTEKAVSFLDKFNLTTSKVFTSYHS